VTTFCSDYHLTTNPSHEEEYCLQSTASTMLGFLAPVILQDKLFRIVARSSDGKADITLGSFDANLCRRRFPKSIKASCVSFMTFIVSLDVAHEMSPSST
jgi:hypothetical protein